MTYSYIQQCLLFFIQGNSWQCHQMKIFSTLLAFSAGNSLITVEFRSQRPVMWSFDVLFDLRLNRQLCKQWRWQWLELPSHSSWHHCNVENAQRCVLGDRTEENSNKSLADPRLTQIYDKILYIGTSAQWLKYTSCSGIAHSMIAGSYTVYILLTWLSKEWTTGHFIPTNWYTG